MRSSFRSSSGNLRADLLEAFWHPAFGMVMLYRVTRGLPFRFDLPVILPEVQSEKQAQFLDWRYLAIQTSKQVTQRPPPINAHLN